MFSTTPNWTDPMLSCIEAAEAVLRYETALLPFKLQTYGASIVGGSVLNILLWAFHGKRQKASDFDLYVPDLTLRRECIDAAMQSGYTKQSHPSAPEAAAWEDPVRNIKIDFMCSVGDDLASTLARFDLNVCMCAFDGNLLVLPGVFRAIETLTATATRSLAASRRHKYSRKGFRVVEPYQPIPVGVHPPTEFRHGGSGFTEYADWQAHTGWTPDTVGSGETGELPDDSFAAFLAGL